NLFWCPAGGIRRSWRCARPRRQSPSLADLQPDRQFAQFAARLGQIVKRLQDKARLLPPGTNWRIVETSSVTPIDVRGLNRIHSDFRKYSYAKPGRQYQHNQQRALTVLDLGNISPFGKRHSNSLFASPVCRSLRQVIA